MSTVSKAGSNYALKQSLWSQFRTAWWPIFRLDPETVSGRTVQQRRLLNQAFADVVGACNSLSIVTIESGLSDCISTLVRNIDAGD
ncbi:unnamed protein product [Protopolystoma xenopodis]|uniref:Uncharacterized protein n=1 Tax=Protopolystoma xenopodis TaxID=117903 RepID=A0A448XGQ2_9PLAT|nr:unnamed protein product [Protopolystoma xenopodis]